MLKGIWKLTNNPNAHFYFIKFKQASFSPTRKTEALTLCGFIKHLVASSQVAPTGLIKIIKETHRSATQEGEWLFYFLLHCDKCQCSFSCVSAAFSSLEFCEIPKLQRSGVGREWLGCDRRIFKGNLLPGHVALLTKKVACNAEEMFFEHSLCRMTSACHPVLCFSNEHFMSVLCSWEPIMRRCRSWWKSCRK